MKKTHIISIAEIAGILVHYTDRFVHSKTFVKLRGKPGKEDKLTQEQSARYARYFLQDLINERMFWVDKPSHTHREYLVEVLSWWGDDLTHSTLDILYHEKVLDEIHVLLYAGLDEIIPEKTWHMWHYESIGDDTLVLEQGEDYRIVDWTRRIESGEWRRE